MYTQELKVTKDIEIKFLRLLPPSLNTLSLPLSSVYNGLDIKESKEYPLVNKFKNFDIPSLNCVSMENLFSLTTSFGKILVNETLEGLMTFSNISEHEVVIKDLEVMLKIDEKQETKTKEKKEMLETKFPAEGVSIPARKSYTIKITKKLEYVSKYTIDINLRIRSTTYNYQYNVLKQKAIIKENGKDYCIVNGNVEVYNNKKLTFDVHYPFKVNEKFHNYQMNICFIETKIINNTIYPLTISDLSLSPKSNPKLKIPSIESLEEIKKNLNDYSPIGSKFFTLQPEEEINILFKITETNLFYDENKFRLLINWANLFDPNPKTHIYEFSNTLNTFNDNYKITVAEKPEGDIIENQNFKITLKLETKRPDKKFIVTLGPEPLRDNDKSNDRELEIIDIIEKKIELNQKTPSNNFILICKSDVLGNVYLPRLKFLLYEEKNNNPNGNVYDALLSFNCVPKEN